MRTVWPVAVAMLAFGCAQQSATETVLVQAQQRPGVSPPPARGETQAVVRSFVTEGGRAREVSGAACEAASAYATAAFTTPARLALPDLGPQTPALNVTCSLGAQTGGAAARPQLRATNGLGGWPAVGVSVGTGGGGGVGVSLGGFWDGGWGRGPQAQRAVYPETRVMLD